MIILHPSNLYHESTLILLFNFVKNDSVVIMLIYMLKLWEIVEFDAGATEYVWLS